MKYCRVVIETPGRGRVYKKDFLPQNIFGPLARAFASECVIQGIVPEDTHFSAVIVARYEDAFVKDNTIENDADLASQRREAWITLAYHNDIPFPDQPITFFTLELYFQEAGTIYRLGLPVNSVDYFWTPLQDTLRRMHVLGADEKYTPQIYIRDDSEADFEREEISLAAEPGDGDEPLFELVEAASPEPDFLAKSPEDFTVIEVRDVQVIGGAESGSAGMCEVFITRQTLAALETIARQDVQVEQGGMLVGNVYRSTAPGSAYLVTITGCTFAEGATASLVELRYNFEAWQRQTAQLKEQFPGQQIVGWYHTHLIQAQAQNNPPVAPETAEAAEPGEPAGGEIVSTAFFFSADDRFMHRQFFAEKWYVAMVLDPAGRAVFFQWFGDEIEPGRRFHIIE